MAQRKSLREIKVVLEALARTEAVVIGGQAVNLWAEHYRLRATIRCGINFQEAIPSELWRNREGPLGDFMKREWQIWAEETAQKVADLQELDRWIESLKNEPNAPD